MRIGKEELIKIFNISDSTYARRLKDGKWVKSIGGKLVKGKTNKKWTFDEEKARKVRLKEMVESGEIAEPEETEEVHEGLIHLPNENLQEIPEAEEVVNEQSIPAGIPLQISDGSQLTSFGDSFINRLERALVLPHQKFYTVDEAHVIYRFTKKYLKTLTETIGGRLLIRKSKLDKI